MLKMMAIADDRHFSYQNEIELVQFIASEMQKEGLDLNNEENLDSYLNTKFMELPLILVLYLRGPACFYSV